MPGGVEPTVHGRAVGAEADAREGAARGVEQAAAGGCPPESRPHVQRHSLHAALHEPVNVEIPGGDRDPALGDHARDVGVDRRRERDARVDGLFDVGEAVSGAAPRRRQRYGGAAARGAKSERAGVDPRHEVVLAGNEAAKGLVRRRTLVVDDLVAGIQVVVPSERDARAGGGEPARVRATDDGIRRVECEPRVEARHSGGVGIRERRPRLQISAGCRDGPRPQHVVVDVLPRILVGVVPGVTVEVEVLGRLHVHLRGADLPRHVDAAVGIDDAHGSGLVVDPAGDVDVGRGQHLGDVLQARVAADGEGILRDADRLVEDGPDGGQRRIVEVDPAGRQCDVLAVHDHDLRGIADDRVADDQVEGRLVRDLDRGVGRGAQSIEGQGPLPRGVGLDKHGPRRHLQVWRLEEHRIQFPLDDGDRFARGRVRLGRQQAVGPQRILDLRQLHLVAGQRLGIALMAGDPGEQRVALVGEQRTEVSDRQRRGIDLQRLDAKEPVRQAGLGLLPPVAGDGAVEFAGRGGRGRLGLGEEMPAARDPVILAFEGEISRDGGHVAVVGTAHAALIRPGDHLHERARGDRERDMREIDRGVHVPQLDGQREQRLLRVGEFAAQP